MSDEPIAKITENVLAKLQELSEANRSADGFVDICAKDVGITDSALFAKQLNKMCVKDFINWRQTENPTSMNYLRLSSVIKDCDTKITLAVTIKGKFMLEQLQSIQKINFWA